MTCRHGSRITGQWRSQEPSPWTGGEKKIVCKSNPRSFHRNNGNEDLKSLAQGILTGKVHKQIVQTVVKPYVTYICGNRPHPSRHGWLWLLTKEVKPHWVLSPVKDSLCSNQGEVRTEDKVCLVYKVMQGCVDANPPPGLLKIVTHSTRSSAWTPFTTHKN